MNINNSLRKNIYIIVLILISLMLLREYTYVHPINPGWGILGPRWTYSSTRTFTWWFLLIIAILFTTPLIRKQKIGFLGIIFLIAVIVRPLIQEKFPEETSKEYYLERKNDLNSIVNKYSNKNGQIINEEIKEIGFEKLIIKDNNFYFLYIDEDFPYGICYSLKNKLPKEIFNSNLKFKPIQDKWYEFDY